MNDSTIPKDIFGSVKATAGFHAIKPYSTSAATLTVLHDTLEQWRITPYKLGKLLGMNSTSLAYKWANGESKPSPYYCILIIRLYQQVYFHGLRLDVGV